MKKPIPKHIRESVYERDRFICQYCGEDLSKYKREMDMLSVDHIVPKSRGGGNSEENLVTSCKPCNSKKGNIPPWDFWEIMKGQMNLFDEN